MILELDELYFTGRERIVHCNVLGEVTQIIVKTYDTKSKKNWKKVNRLLQIDIFQLN